MSYILIQSLWIFASIIIFVCGIYFSFKLRFIHLNFPQMFKSIKEKSSDENSISAFKSLMMSLAGRIGVGSLSGIALALYLGGPGVLFWIWLTSFLCAINTFVESVLAVVFRKKDYGHIYRGGPFYYIQDGLKNKKLALFYSIIILIAFVCGFSTIQVNTITKCINDFININPMFIGFIIAALTGLTIFGGVKKIADTTSKLVPIMTLCFLAVCIYIILVNINMIPQIFSNIIDSAFNFKAFGSGIITTLLIGMQKGIFSSEVGLGTGSIAAVTADTKSSVSNGLAQTLGIHIENLLIATITVFAICMSNYQNIIVCDPNGIEITLFAFGHHLGSFGNLFIVVTIFFFGLASVLTGYYYGESSLKFIKKTSKSDIILLKILTLVLLVVGSVISSNILWSIVDILVGVIAIINTYAIFKLRHTAINEYKNYMKK